MFFGLCSTMVWKKHTPLYNQTHCFPLYVLARVSWIAEGSVAEFTSWDKAKTASFWRVNAQMHMSIRECRSFNSKKEDGGKGMCMVRRRKQLKKIHRTNPEIWSQEGEGIIICESHNRMLQNRTKQRSNFFGKRCCNSNSEGFGKGTNWSVVDIAKVPTSWLYQHSLTGSTQNQGFYFSFKQYFGR